jgi:hypothetical protein
MSETFNDGDPIDATLLQKLKTDVAKATALAGRAASAGSTINVAGDIINKSAAEIVTPKFYGGRTEAKIPLKAGAYVPFTCVFPKGFFNKKPIVTVSPYAPGKTKNDCLAYAPQILSVSLDSAEGRVRVPSNTPVGDIYMYFIAVQN